MVVPVEQEERVRAVRRGLGAARGAGPGGMAAPELLIFFHIPKTGGTTLDAILRRRFPGRQHFDGQVGTSTSGLAIRPRDRIEAKYHGLAEADQRAVRCVMGTHYPMNIHTLFTRPAKYVTILRPPVERVASHFFDDRRQRHLPCHERIRHMTLEQYLESGLGITAYDNQVRLLCGCPELDVPWDPHGGVMRAPPVEAHHLELAKRNIERHFIAAAPLESFDALLVVLARLYGWTLRDMVFVRHNVGAGREAAPISAAARRWLEDANRYDTALYEWVRARFAAQTAAMPDLIRDVGRYARLNRMAQLLERAAPPGLRRAAARLLSG